MSNSLFQNNTIFPTLNVYSATKIEHCPTNTSMRTVCHLRVATCNFWQHFTCANNYFIRMQSTSHPYRMFTSLDSANNAWSSHHYVGLYVNSARLLLFHRENLMWLILEMLPCMAHWPHYLGVMSLECDKVCSFEAIL